MWKLVLTTFLALFAQIALAAQNAPVYKWVDENGTLHYGDSIPARYSELPKDVLNEHGVKVGSVEGKKTPEQIEAERVAEKRRVMVELQRRADQALLATYLSVEEILMHRDRRIELFQAQSRVTELYLRNLQKRLDSLHDEASEFQPYNADSDAPIVGESLVEDLRVTKETIARHERNLQRFKTDEEQIITRFDGDITRFKVLKGIE